MDQCAGLGSLEGAGPEALLGMVGCQRDAGQAGLAHWLSLLWLDLVLLRDPVLVFTWPPLWAT